MHGPVPWTLDTSIFPSVEYHCASARGRVGLREIRSRLRRGGTRVAAIIPFRIIKRRVSSRTNEKLVVSGSLGCQQIGMEYSLDRRGNRPVVFTTCGGVSDGRVCLGHPHSSWTDASQHK